MKPQRRRKRRFNWRDDRGDVAGIEVLFGTLFLILLFLFLCQITVWWHAKNILEQSAAEGARMAAAANGTCGDANTAASSIASQMGGSWVNGLNVSCGGQGPAGATITVTVSASTPMFGVPGSMRVSATATAPSEGTLTGAAP